MSKARIIEAVQQLDLEAARMLLEAKPALLTVVNRRGRNLLHLACGADCARLEVPQSEAVRMVRHLLDLGMDIEAPGLSGRDPCPPLFFAVAFGRNPRVVRLLLERGAKATAAPGGGLFAAAWWDDTENLGLLIKAGAPIDVEVGVTPFLAAWGWKRFNAARFLAQRGADVNARDTRGRTALRVGVEREYEPAQLRWLVAHGASPDIAGRDGVTARARAARKRDKRFLAALG